MSLAAHSRRALVVATTALAAAPVATMAKKKRKKKSPAPLAYAVVVATDVDSLGDGTCRVVFEIAWSVPGTASVAGANGASLEMAVVPGSDFVASVQAWLASYLAGPADDLDIPANRIAVTVL